MPVGDGVVVENSVVVYPTRRGVGVRFRNQECRGSVGEIVRWSLDSATNLVALLSQLSIA